MKISYNWLKEYIDVDLSPEKISAILTDTGLEVEGMENYESVKGNLEGIVIGKVLTKEKHPNADKLSCTTVDVGKDEPLKIVCGAPNVAAGQTVPVATVGTTLFPFEGEPFQIKKSKIRGEVSEGMICAEDELGLGESHEGIMVLKEDIKSGTPANEYFNIYKDVIFEIGLTPNRTDAFSHLGVARDLMAALNTQEGKKRYTLNKPIVDAFSVDNTDLIPEIVVEDQNACPRYTGITLSGVKVGESPQWLKDKLNAIGSRPINVVVDVTNFVLHELGQPLHAFDMEEISNNKITIKKLAKDTPFTALDGEELVLAENDLMICNESGGMCIGGVFGGIKSGVTEKSSNIFLESACFNPVDIRKTSKHHGLNTDASFRFERGSDPNITVYALKRAAILIKELAGGSVSSKIVDVYPNPVPDFKVNVTYQNINKLIGKNIPKETVHFILNELDIKVVSEDEMGLKLSVPPYRADVQREADIIEEILRIYGYNNIELPEGIRTSAVVNPKPDKEKVKNTIFDYLAANGFHEIMSNSLTKLDYYKELEEFPQKNCVKVLNPLSKELNTLRQTLLFSGLEAILYNKNRQINDLKLFEFGNVYMHNPALPNDADVVKRYQEKEEIALFITGRKQQESYNTPDDEVDFVTLKSYILNIFMLASLKENAVEEYSNTLISKGLLYKSGERILAEIGMIAKPLLKQFDIDQPVFYARIDFASLLKAIRKNTMQFMGIPKYPEVRRDLALLIDKNAKFAEIKEIAYKTERKILKNVNLFDVYEGKNIPQGKKSYAISYFLQDEHKTLKDKEIDKLMNKLIKAYQEKLNAEIR